MSFSARDALESFMADRGRMQFGGGEVGEAAEHDSQAASIWDANPFDTSQYFSLPAPPIPSEDFVLRTTPGIQDRYAVAMGRGHGKSALAVPPLRLRDAFEVVTESYWDIGMLNRPPAHARITGIDVGGEKARVTLQQLPPGVFALDSTYSPIPPGSKVAIKRSYLTKQIDLYADEPKPNYVIASSGIAKALRNVYADFAGKLLAESAAEMKRETERTLFGAPLSRAALDHPQVTRDRLAGLTGRNWSFYGSDPDQDRHDVPEAEAQRLMRGDDLPFQWQDLPPELT